MSPPHHASGRGPWAARLGALALGTALALLLAEGVARWWWARLRPACPYVVDGRPRASLGLYRFDHPRASIALRPGYDHEVLSFHDGETLRYRIDPRGRRRGLPPGDPRPRVVILGDSVAFGLGVPEEDTFAAQLQARDPTRVYLNLGVGGASLGNSLALLDSEGPELVPAWVVLAIFSGNDRYNTGRDTWEGIAAGRGPLGKRIPNLDLDARFDPPWSREEADPAGSALLRLVGAITRPPPPGPTSDAASVFGPVPAAVRDLEALRAALADHAPDAAADSRRKACGLVRHYHRVEGAYGELAPVAEEFLAACDSGDDAAILARQVPLGTVSLRHATAILDERFEFNRTLLALRRARRSRAGLRAQAPNDLIGALGVACGAAGEAAAAACVALVPAVEELAREPASFPPGRVPALLPHLDALLAAAGALPVMELGLPVDEKIRVVLEGMIARSRQLGARLAVVVVPAEYELPGVELGEDARSWVAALGTQLEAAGVPFRDLAPDMVRAWRAERSPLYVDWSHPTRRGHALVADALREMLSSP